MLNASELDQLIAQNALFVINHSGGKDSQAMTIWLHERIPAHQLVIVHSHLPEVEWDNSVEHIEKYSFGIPVYVCQAVKTFFEMVEHRQMFPSKNQRQCTSDLKRGPIEKQIRAIAKERGCNLIVSCQGMRAQESTGRAKLQVFTKHNGQSVAGRTWYNWLPIHDLSTDEVFAIIHNAGQKAFWTYYEGMTRKSCCFCIMANRNDLKIAARLRPELAARYIETERRIGHTLQMSGTPLSELIK